jgi:hypothetical protein
MSFWGMISGSDEKEDDERKARKAAAAAAAAAEEKARQAREQALVIALIKQQQATQQAKQQAEQKAAQQAAQAAKEQQDKTFQSQDQAQQLRQQGEDQAKKILATGYPQQTQMQQNVASPSNFGFSQSQNKATSSQSFTSPQIARQAPQQTMETAPLVNQKSGGTQRPLNRYNSPQISGLAFGGS